MNTGSQRSGTTPQGAITANTPIKGKLQQKKDVPAIMAAHGIDYVATASAAYPLDLYDKITKAITLRGVKYIHIHTPCPPGWGYDARYTVKIGELAVETGYWDLYEVETGEFRLTGASARTLKKGGRKPAKEYLQTQSRFRIMSPEQAADVQARVDARWSTYASGEGC